MDSPDIKQEQHDDDSTDGGDNFECGENFLKEELNLTDGEEGDLEATLKSIQDRTPHISRPSPTSSSLYQQLPIIDFLRSFLFQRGMTETLECFETEWAELVHKGEVDEKRIEPVPEIYTETQRLDEELKYTQRVKDEYRRAASVATEALLRAQRARDAHRLQHQRVVQENNRLIGQIKRLKLQCDRFQPEVKRMSEKYQAVSKQVMQVALEKEEKLLRGTNQAALTIVSSSLPINDTNAPSK